MVISNTKSIKQFVYMVFPMIQNVLRKTDKLMDIIGLSCFNNTTKDCHFSIITLGFNLVRKSC